MHIFTGSFYQNSNLLTCFIPSPPHPDTFQSDLNKVPNTSVASVYPPFPALARLSQPSVTQFSVCRLNVIMTTCNTCPSCKSFVHDEEIMASWSPDESEYSIPCPFCEAAFAPLITVRILGDVYTPNFDGSVAESCSETTSPLASGPSPIQRRGSLTSMYVLTLTIECCPVHYLFFS